MAKSFLKVHFISGGISEEKMKMICDFKFIWKHLFKTLLTPDTNYNMLYQIYATFFSYLRVIQNHQPTPVRNSKYLSIPPAHPFALT